MVSALIIGFLFGFLLKRSRFCPSGTIRDIRLEGYVYNFVLLFSLIAIEGFIYHILLLLKLVPSPQFRYFSFLSVAIGGFIFGFGAVLSNGCVTSTLVKVGDGRFTGIVSIIAFVLGVAIAKTGILKPLTQFLASKILIKDELYKISPFLGLSLFGFLLIIFFILMFFHNKKHKVRFKLPQKYKGLRHVLFEKTLTLESFVILSGVLMGIGFYFSNLTGRNDGFGITVPLFSLFNLVFNNKLVFDWGMLLVLGIILGVFLTSLMMRRIFYCRN